MKKNFFKKIFKVNTPVDMKKAKEISSNGSGSESYYSDDYSYDKSTKKT